VEGCTLATGSIRTIGICGGVGHAAKVTVMAIKKAVCGCSLESRLATIRKLRVAKRLRFKIRVANRSVAGVVDVHGLAS
jgi:hypothetical protein